MREALLQILLDLLSGGHSGWITGATHNMRSSILAQAPQYQTQAAIETHGQSKNGMLFHYLFCSWMHICGIKGL